MGHLKNLKQQKQHRFKQQNPTGGTTSQTTGGENSSAQMWGGLAVGVAGFAGAAIALNQAKKKNTAISDFETTISDLENSRVAVTNVYSGVSDLSSMLSNPYANLGVATKSAEIQMEQNDIALANTLDVIRASGAGAGGATALAQAALKSKQAVTANLEQQEAKNEQLRAQGEWQLQQAKMTEAQRLQTSDVEGRKWMFEKTDAREQQKLDRTQAQLDQARVEQLALQEAGWGMAGQTLGALGTVVGSMGGE
jgi:hypothetical protein